ncbi:hypothetical protein [Halorhabdus rudnickae]|uniref:hypothetical protein n=1 Tax=Halorhabdus rudnickae TaxID=1775544 RepID=UPI00108290DF|nr:hypothetical protein [Halorhabdus rudnickae]
MALLSRREYLHLSGAAAASTGCLGFENNDVPDLAIFNRRDQETTITTLVTRLSDNRDILNNTITILKDGNHAYENPINREGVHRIRVSTEDGQENQYEWDAPSDEAYGIHITIDGENIEYSEVVA